MTSAFFAALQAITINPARHLGIEDRVGSIEVGKDADFVVKGNVRKIARSSMITNTEDTYISTQIGVRVEVDYQIVDMKNGRVLVSSQASEEGNFFNEVGSTESAFESAISYATRRIADEITTNLVTR